MAGGLGTRMKSETPKHLHPLLGRRMVDWVLASAEPLGASPVVVVCSPQTEDAMRASLDGSVTLAVQPQARGTGDAVASARGALDGFDGDVLVLSGDTPMLRAELLADLVEAHRAGDAAATIEGLDAHNAQGELYLTDAIEHLVNAGQRVGVHTAPDATDAEGVNTRVELAEAAAVLRDRINTAHMLAGAAIVDPGSTWIDPDV